MVKVLVVAEVSEEQAKRIRAVSEDMEVVFTRDRAQQAIEIVDTNVVYGGVNRELFAKAQKLRWVQNLGAGVEGSLFPEFVASDVILISEKGIVGTHLAEQAFALLLALTRGIKRSVLEQTWDNKSAIRAAAWELTGRTMGIVGLGGTGVEVARRAAAFGMHVIAVDPEPVFKPAFVAEVWGMYRFYDLLARSDVVAIGAPLTPQTRGMFNLAVFKRMKSTAILLNVTRGPIMDGPSLVQALQQGLIAGAGLDVTSEEPLPSDSPLWDMDNVVITPHVAGASPFRMDRSVDLFCENLQRFLAGESLKSVIDKQKGY